MAQQSRMPGIGGEQQVAEDRRLLIDLARMALGEYDRASVLAEALKIAMSITASDYAILLERTAEEDFLVTAGAGEAVSQAVGVLHVAGEREASPSGSAADANAAVYSSVTGHVASVHLPKELAEIGVRTAIDVPVRGRSGLHGVMQVGSSSTSILDRFAAERLLDVADLLGFALDAEARRTAQDQATEANAIALSEADHRVANSLAMVAAGLSWEARQTAGDIRSLHVLNAAAARIRAIGAAHHRLHKHGGDKMVAVADMLIAVAQEVSTALFDCPERLRCEVEPAAAAVLWPTSRAVAISTIAVELLTNAAKHAGTDKPVDLKLRAGSSNELLLVVEDCGGGARELRPGCRPWTWNANCKQHCRT